MAYFKIKNPRTGVTTDYSLYVNKLIVDNKHKYTARENAAGNLMVKYITKKRNVQVGIIPLEDTILAKLLTDLNEFQVKVTFLNPQTKGLETIDCIIPIHSVEYYTIRAGKTMAKAFTFTCEEL